MAKQHRAGRREQRRRRGRQQLDLFAAFGDVPLRDDREGMSVPLVSLSKNKRTEPIEWRSTDGEQYAHVTANATHGMATIWDWDVVLWAVSQINDAVNAGQPVSPMLGFRPHDLLRAIGRGVGGDHYAELEAALNRLAGTLVETNIRTVGGRRKSSFHLLERWDHDVDDAGRSKGMTMELPRWLYEGVVKHDVLAVPREYFDLTSGIARFLYRIARRHAGRQKDGFRLSMQNLHARSGSVQPLKEFARGVRKVMHTRGVPEYRMGATKDPHGGEVVSMTYDPAKAKPQNTLARKPSPAWMFRARGTADHPPGHGGSPARTRRITRRS